MSDYLLLLCLLATAHFALRLVPAQGTAEPSRLRVAIAKLSTPPRPRKVPDYIAAGRREQLRRNAGRWEKF